VIKSDSTVDDSRYMISDLPFSAITSIRLICCVGMVI
jgi:hypothetical protein